MRYAISDVPARRLRSVALRDRHVLATRAADGASHREWNWASRAQAGPGKEPPQLRRQRLEAVLLLAREPLNSRKLAHFAGLADGTEARTLIRELNRSYNESGRAFCIEEVGGGFQLLTRPQFAPWLRRLEHIPPEVRLSAPSLETLAVVAYRQPVLRADIEAIRGVSCGEILRQLLERDLIRIGGRSDELGRPYLYTTTRRFLKLFGLQSLEQLPRADVLSARDGSAQSVETVDGMQDVRDDPTQEEKSEVSVTSPTPLLVNESLDLETTASRVAATAASPAQYDNSDLDGVDEDDFDDEEDEDDWDEEEDYDEDYDDEEDEDYEEDFDEDEDEDPYEDYEDEEWEEVDDDYEEDEEEDADWEDDEDDDWDDEEEED